MEREEGERDGGEGRETRKRRQVEGDERRCNGWKEGGKRREG